MPKFNFDQLSPVARHIIIMSTRREVDSILENDDGGLEIQLIVNGVDVSRNFNKLGDSIDRQWKDDIDRRAREIVAEKYQDLIDQLEAVKQSLFPYKGD